METPFPAPLKHCHSRCKLIYVELIGLHNTHSSIWAILTLYRPLGIELSKKIIVKYVITFSLKYILEIRFFGEGIFIC